MLGILFFSLSLGALSGFRVSGEKDNYNQQIAVPINEEEVSPDHLFLHLLDPDERAAHVRNTHPRRRGRIDQNDPFSSFVPSVKILKNCLYDTAPALVVCETKGGIYQYQDSFLPAYYQFLFRYTLF